MADEPLNTDSEDEMPHNWEERVTVDGKVFYACHETQKTQWTHPVSGKRKKVTGELPYGWERKIGDSGYVYFVDHVNQKTTFTDPRLAFAVEDKNIDGDVSNLRQKFDANSSALQVLAGRDLSNKYAIVTGGTSGIGAETVKSLAMHGCHVTIPCRNQQLGETLREEILKTRPEAQIVLMDMDLSSLASVKKFSEEYINTGWPVHMLILNAGVLYPPYTLTEDNLELSFQVNCFSHFYLCNLLADLLKKSAPSRIVHVSSESHRYTNIPSVDDLVLEKLSPDAKTNTGLIGLAHYGTTKLLNVVISNALNQRLAKYKVFSNSLHPGNMINTSLSRSWWGYRLLFKIVQPFTKSLQQGAATTLYVATNQDLEDVGGTYFNNCWVCEPSEQASNKDFCEKAYSVFEKLLLAKTGLAALS